MKDFLLIIKTEGNVWTDLSPEQLQQHLEHGSKYINKLVEKQLLKNANPIESNNSRIVTTLDNNLTDLPLNNTKEVVAGFFHISASDINEAVQIAKENPIFKDISTNIEVHSLMPIGGN